MAELTEQVLQWSPVSFFMGVNVCMFANTTNLCISLYRKKKSRFFLALAVLSACRIAHCVLIPVLIRDVGIVGQWLTLATYLQWVLSTGFTVLNITRLHRMCGTAMPRVVRTLAVLSGLSITVCGVAVIWYHVVLATYGFSPLLRAPRTMIGLWDLSDGIINAAISLTFVIHLQNLIAGTAGMPTMRTGIVKLIHRVQIMLACECVLIVMANILRLINTRWDPNWVSILFAESIRQRIYCVFLKSLHRVMSSSVKSTTGGGGHSQTASNTGRGSSTTQQSSVAQSHAHNTSGDLLRRVPSDVKTQEGTGTLLKPPTLQKSALASPS
ncbi:hypothetical protein H9P43_004367 [Blastocladiella emersonii ATCC 22665]|nr:hypothetical protein H9P43_004367 [Blastocladiella emersonii ATCC 22665]